MLNVTSNNDNHHATANNPPATSPKGLLFELHRVSTVPNPIHDVADLPWYAQHAPDSQPILQVAADDGILWARVIDGVLEVVPQEKDATLGFCAVKRQFSIALAMLAREEGVLVDGVPALRLTVLDSRSSITIPGTAAIFYVTERFSPYVGRPTHEMIGCECPSCKIPVELDTSIVSCRCGRVYHDETAESHPHLPEADRLACFQQTQICIDCKERLTTEEHLLWSPGEI